VSPNKTREINVVFSEEAYREMEELARRRRATVPDLIIDGIALLKWFDERMRKREPILIKRGRELKRVVSVSPSDTMIEESRRLEDEVEQQRAQGPEEGPIGM
jgi:hypothetical protein